MRIDSVDLRAFGPFTDCDLRLNDGDQGLHIIFGPNEAGKSSALRAVSALLFGIPERTQDGFLHRKQDLRVGGRLRSAQGEKIVCYRRKGRKNTLLDAQDKPIDEDRLKSFLGGVDERLFHRLFGIDHQSLTTGGQALLEERGREAEALFGSGIGRISIHSVLAGLDREAEELFVPRGSTRVINAKLLQIQEIGRRIRSTSLSARDWENALEVLERTQDKLRSVDEQLATALVRRSALERIRRTLPGLAKRAMILQQLHALRDVPLLDDAFVQRHEDAWSKRRLALETHRNADQRVAGLTKSIAEVVVSGDLLAHEEAINDLREQLGSYRKAKRERPKLAAELSLRLDQAEQLITQFAPDTTLGEVGRLRVQLGKRRRVADLGGRKAAQLLAVTNTKSQVVDLRNKLKQQQNQLENLSNTPPIDDLKATIESALRLGDMDAVIGELERRLTVQGDQCTRELAALGLWQAGLDAIATAAFPSEQRLRRFESEFDALEDERRRIAEIQNETYSDRNRYQAALRTLELTGSVPTETDLALARDRRNQRWRLLCKLWVEGENIDLESAGFNGDLTTEFETEMFAADEISDRLRRESQRVLEKAAAAAGLEASEARDQDAMAALQKTEDRWSELNAAWQTVWEALGVSPLSPSEMRYWLVDISKLRDKLARSEELRTELAGLRQTREKHLQSVQRVLMEIGKLVENITNESLSVSLRYAERVLNALEAQQRSRTSFESSVAELQDSLQRVEPVLADAESALATWQHEWQGLMGELNLALDVTPEAALDYLQGVERIISLIDEAKQLRQGIDNMDTESDQLAARMTVLSQQLAPDLMNMPFEEAITLLHGRLDEEKARKNRLIELQDQLGKAQREVIEAEAATHGAEEVLQELCAQAGCDNPEDLVQVERRDRDKRALTEQLTIVERELLDGGDGLDLDTLVAEGEAMEHDGLLSELDTLERLIEQELRPEREQLVAAKVNAERDFNEMAGGDRASQLAEEQQQLLSELRVLSERYLRARLSSYVLRAEIERFRKQHRDPILVAASEYFRRLTCDAFVGIQSNYDEADLPVLVGARSTGMQLRVENMSTGTRDQLYLALRLATLDHYLENAEPLPFIIDDILVQFDDNRAYATLAALADFSDRTQVILFTHHSRVVDQAGDLENAAGRVFVHRLP